MISDLYNTDILSLSAGLKNARLSSPDASARKVSKLCGSWVEIDIKMDGETVSDFALRVQACALGQASAGVLQEMLIGATLEEVTSARTALRAMLKAGGAPPKGRFSRLTLLRSVADYPARHNSVLLAFSAAQEAIESAKSAKS